MDIEYSNVVCAYCEDPIEIGAEVKKTFDGDIVHGDCWRWYCEDMLCDTVGYMGRDDIE